MQLLGEEAKDDARRLLKESQSQDVLITCLKLLKEEAQEDARYLLKKYRHNDFITLACIHVLGDEALETAKKLYQTAKGKYVKESCRNLLFKQETSLGNLFPQLAQLKNNAEKKE